MLSFTVSPKHADILGSLSLKSWAISAALLTPLRRDNSARKASHCSGCIGAEYSVISSLLSEVSRPTYCPRHKAENRGDTGNRNGLKRSYQGFGEHFTQTGDDTSFVSFEANPIPVAL